MAPSKPPPSVPPDAAIVIETARGAVPATVRRAVSPSPDPAKSAELLRVGADSARALSAPPNGHMTPLLTPAPSLLPVALSPAHRGSLHAGGTATPHARAVECLATSSRVSPGRCRSSSP